MRVLIGQLHAGDQEVILLVAGVGAEDQAVHAVILSLRSGQDYFVNVRISGSYNSSRECLTW